MDQRIIFIHQKGNQVTQLQFNLLNMIGSKTWHVHKEGPRNCLMDHEKQEIHKLETCWN